MLDRYERQVAIHSEIWSYPAPPLPQNSDPWSVRRQVIGRLAEWLFPTWYDHQIARLLNEVGVQTEQGGKWYPQRVAYSRTRYGRRVA